MRPTVEEDGDEIFTPMPTRCVRYDCRGRVRKQGRWMRCEKCGASYGEAADMPRKRKGGGL